MNKALSMKAFTLIELLLVMLIMALILASGVAGFIKIRDRQELRGGTTSIRQSMGLAHQHAVTKRERVYIAFSAVGASPGWFKIANNVGLIGETNYMPPGVRLFPPPTNIWFYPGGNVDNPGTNCVVLTHKTVPGTNVITVYNLTGLVDVEEK